MTQVHETYNLTPFVAEFSIIPNSSGNDLLVGILKASFDFDEKGSLAVSPRERMLSVLKADQFYNEPGQSSVQYPSDLTPAKDGTDIVINGHVYGNGKNRVYCGFGIGDLSKILVVTGHRVWNRILTFYKITGPFPFDKISLTYENAFGGEYTDKKGTHRYAFNPVGKGFGVKHLERALLPNIEYRDCRVTSIYDRPRPAGLSAIPASWKQRLRYAGTYDDNWKASRFPLPSLDMKPAFNNAVPQDQVYKPKLTGSEKLKLINLHESNPELSLKIPKASFTVTVRIKNETVSKPMEMDTCLVEPDEKRLVLTYAARLPLQVDARYVKSVHFQMNGKGSKWF